MTTALAGAWFVFASANGWTWSSVALLAAALVLPAVLVATRAAAYLKLALQQPDLVADAARLGMEVASSTPQDLRDMIRADSDEWKVWVKKIGFTAES